jgi:hypothetical protein
MSVTGSGDHVFGRVRPSHDGDYQLNGTTVRVTTFRDLPYGVPELGHRS